LPIPLAVSPAMDTLLRLGFMIFVVGAVVFSLILAWKFKQKAEISVKEYAQRKGYEYIGNMYATLKPLLKHTPLSRGGSEKALYGVKHGAAKDAVTTCLWEFLVSHGRHTETIWYMIAMKPIRLRTPGWVILRKEDIGDKVKSALGKNDLDFESKEFSDYFYVNASPEKLGYQFFHPRMIEHFLKNREYGMFVHYDVILVYKRVWTPDIFGMFKYIRTGFTPIIDWMEVAKVAMREVEEHIPDYLLYLEARNLDEEDEIAKVVEDEDCVQVECPDCSHRFKVAESAKKLKCPKCGAEGEV
jgi:hypothetical protein